MGGVLLNGLDFEVETNEGEDQALDILHKVVEATKPFLVSATLDVNQRPNLCGCKGNVLISCNNLQLLSTHSVWLGP